MTKKFFTLILLILSITHLFILHDTVSAAPLVLKKGIDTYSLKSHLAFFQDNNGTAGIDKIESPNFQNNFVRGNQGTFQQTDHLVPVWIRFTLDFSELSKKSVNNKWMLRFSWPFIQMIELYGKNMDGIWEKKKAGIIHTFQKPYGPGKFIALDLNNPKNDLATYYVRIVAHDRVPTTLEIYSKDAVFTKARFISLCQGLFYGILLAMAFYNLMMWIFLKQQSYLWYVLSVAFLSVYFLGFNGLLYQFAPSFSGPWIYPPILLSWLSISSITLILFIRNFMLTKKHTPIIDKLLLVCMALWAIELILIFTVSSHISIFIANILGLIFSLLMTVTAIICRIRGFKPALMIFIAFIFTSIGGIFFSLTLFGFIPYTPLGFYGFQIGTAFEMVFFSLALAQRVRLLNQEKEIFKSGQERYRDLSRKDALTGLFNKRWLVKTLGKKIDHAKKSSDLLSIAMIDIDHFKNFNDNHGHQAGDKVLKRLADVMQSCLRKEDAACRYGGEEFTLILPDMDAQGAFAVAERIRLKLETTSLDLNETDSVRITASIGIACLTREKSLETFIEKADDALYMAKKNGRNQTFIAQ